MLNRDLAFAIITWLRNRRAINLLSDICLVYGYGQNRKRIDENIVLEVVRDKLDGKRIWTLKERRSTDVSPCPGSCQI